MALDSANSTTASEAHEGHKSRANISSIAESISSGLQRSVLIAPAGHDTQICKPIKPLRATRHHRVTVKLEDIPGLRRFTFLPCREWLILLCLQRDESLSAKSK
ncbi:hypothetical protein J6590_043615 [Homalodisca vitripennis]|nr:hypothetical protein J6590_043615 [Homalodisca vitripennis]